MGAGLIVTMTTLNHTTSRLGECKLPLKTKHTRFLLHLSHFKHGEFVARFICNNSNKTKNSLKKRNIAVVVLSLYF